MLRMPGDKLRVALLGPDADVSDWAGVLSSRPIEILRASDLGAALGFEPDLVVVSATLQEGARLGTALAGEARRPPAVFLLGSESGPHPHTRMLKALAQAKWEWEGAFDAMVDPVLVLDDRGKVSRANLALAQALEAPIVEVVGIHYAELLGSVREGTDAVAETLAHWEATTGEARYARLPGIRQVTTSPLVGADGARRGVVVTLKDVTDLKDQQERLLQAARLADIGQLAAGVAHEINTPLASIALRAESLLKAAEDQRLQALDSFRNFPRYLKTINEEIFRCKKIISALLEFSRARKPEVKEVDLNVLCEKAADLLGHQMRLRQVKLSLKLAAGPLHIRGDDGQLRQVLLALLVNALDATSAGGGVAIETGRQATGEALLAVADDGVGIPPEHLDRIFSPFFTTKPPGKGTGLGLAICHGVVAAHGGQMRVESEVGRGTRVSLILPAGGADTRPAREA